MTTLPHIISMSNLERQTGMTMLGVAMVNGAFEAGDSMTLAHPSTPKPLFVARSQELADWTCKFRGLSRNAATWAACFLRDNGFTPSLVVIDDCDEYKFHELRQLIGAIVNRMQTITTPCQIVLLRNPFNVKDLF